jgi:hypothetical protein
MVVNMGRTLRDLGIPTQRVQTEQFDVSRSAP